MEKNPRDNMAVRIPPPLLFLGCLGFGLLLEYLFPLHLINIPLLSRVIAGFVFMLISGFIALGAFVAMIKNKTPFDTRKPVVKIVKDGSFRFSRNPLYLSLLLLLSGIAVLNSSVWLFMAIPLLYILLLFNAVLPEEKYLLKKFGKEYSDYSAKVRRWL